MFYFRCTANPKAAIMPVEFAWEAAELKRHPDYEEVDAEGVTVTGSALEEALKIERGELAAPGAIPAPKRPILGLPKKD